MGNGKRYNSGQKLNMKKVVATILAFIVLVMAIVTFVKWIRGAGSAEERKVAISYYSVYTNGKWGVIDSTGKVIVEPKYELKNNIIIDFIKNWHLAVDWDANYYTDIEE